MIHEKDGDKGKRDRNMTGREHGNRTKHDKRDKNHSGHVKRGENMTDHQKGNHSEHRKKDIDHSGHGKHEKGMNNSVTDGG